MDLGSNGAGVSSRPRCTYPELTVGGAQGDARAFGPAAKRKTPKAQREQKPWRAALSHPLAHGRGMDLEKTDAPGALRPREEHAGCSGKRALSCALWGGGGKLSAISFQPQPNGREATGIREQGTEGRGRREGEGRADGEMVRHAPRLADDARFGIHDS